jgi:hypothetical protein
MFVAHPAHHGQPASQAGSREGAICAPFLSSQFCEDEGLHPAAGLGRGVEGVWEHLNPLCNKREGVLSDGRRARKKKLGRHRDSIGAGLQRHERNMERERARERERKLAQRRYRHRHRHRSVFGLVFLLRCSPVRWEGQRLNPALALAKLNQL